jgi:hypothetical protein
MHTLMTEAFQSGQGTGSGVVRAVLEAVIQLIVADDSIWRCRLDEKFFTLIPSFASSLARRT